MPPVYEYVQTHPIDFLCAAHYWSRQVESKLGVSGQAEHAMGVELSQYEPGERDLECG